MENKKNIIIVCGETSGDINAANLAKEIKAINPELKIYGVGSTNLRNAQVEIIYDIKDLAVMGLFDVLKKLPRFFALKKLILKKIDEENPQAIILVDFSGFNLRLAKAINKKIPVIYYTSPQIWASRPGRIESIKKYVSKMLVFFQFEKDFYTKQDFPVDFIGHPLLDVIKPTTDKNIFLKSLGLSDANPTIALLPGSRKQEIKNILPLMLKATQKIKNEIPKAQFIIAKAPNVDLEKYINNIAKLGIKIADNQTYNCINSADFCLVCSGTATLETTILGVPFALVYKMGLLNYLLYRPQIKIQYIGITNIIAGKEIIPEFIQYKATPKIIAQSTINSLQSPEKNQEIRQKLSEIKLLLGESGASQRAAQIVNSFIK